MASEIRVLRDEDLERWKQVESVAFMDTIENTSSFADHMKPEWTLAAFDGGVLQASVSSVPYRLGLEGTEVAMGGVTAVACMPEYRRQGLVGELLRQTLVRSRDRGEPLSGLWTPHPALYRRYGWEVATDMVEHVFAPKSIALEPGPAGGGRVVRRTADGWAEADRAMRQWTGRRNSALIRDESRWKAVLTLPPRELFTFVGESGQPEGHALLRIETAPEGKVLHVPELVALTEAAHRALWTLVLSHDLVQKVHYWGSSDDPLLDTLADPSPVERRLHRGLLLRVVDITEAMVKRPAYADGRLVIRVLDDACPWNAGTWEIASAGSHLSAERCDDEPMLTVDARALAQLYNGYRSATNLVRTGRIEAHHPRAVAIADILFAMRTPPFCGDDF